MSNQGTPLALGIDYGTLSGRVLVLDLGTGAELAAVDVPYSHGAIEETLPGSGMRLEPDWALQHPLDYIDVIDRGIPQALALAAVDPGRVIGIGVDFTSCTVLPTAADGAPLCLQDAVARPTPRLAQALEAPRGSGSRRPAHRTRTRAQRGLPLPLRRTDLIGVVLPQAAPDLRGGPRGLRGGRQVHRGHRLDRVAAHRAECRCSCANSYKAFWSPDAGLPSAEYFDAVAAGFSGAVAEARN